MCPLSASLDFLLPSPQGLSPLIHDRECAEAFSASPEVQEAPEVQEEPEVQEKVKAIWLRSPAPNLMPSNEEVVKTRTCKRKLSSESPIEVNSQKVMTKRGKVQRTGFQPVSYLPQLFEGFEYETRVNDSLQSSEELASEPLVNDGLQSSFDKQSLPFESLKDSLQSSFGQQCLNINSLAGTFWKRDTWKLIKHFENAGDSPDVVLAKTSQMLQDYHHDDHTKTSALMTAVKMEDSRLLQVLLKAFPYSGSVKESVLMEGISTNKNNEQALIELVQSLGEISFERCLRILKKVAFCNLKKPLLMSELKAMLTKMTAMERGQILIVIAKTPLKNEGLIELILQSGPITSECRQAAITGALALEIYLGVFTQDTVNLIANSGPLLSDDELGGIQEIDENDQWRDELLIPDWVRKNNWNEKARFLSPFADDFYELNERYYVDPIALCGISKNEAFKPYFEQIKAKLNEEDLEVRADRKKNELLQKSYLHLRFEFYDLLHKESKNDLFGLLKTLSEKDRGKLLLEFAAAPEDNFKIVKLIHSSGSVSMEDRGASLIAAAGASISKADVVGYLASGEIDEGGLLIERSSKENLGLKYGEDLNTSARSKAILEAVKRGYVDVVDVLVTTVELLDSDNALIEAMYEAIKHQDIPIFELLRDVDGFVDGDWDNFITEIEQFGYEKLLERC